MLKGWERTQEDLKQEQDAIKVIEKGDLSIWQKLINHNEFIKSREIYKTPQLCKNDNVDVAWFKKMETCITPLPEVSNDDEVATGELQKWPKMVFVVVPRISGETIPGITPKNFEEDNKLWKVDCKFDEIEAFY